MKPGDKVLPWEPLVIEPGGDSVNHVVRWGGFTFPATINTTNLRAVTGGPLELWGIYKDGELRSVDTSMDDGKRDTHKFWGYEVEPLIAYRKITPPSPPASGEEA